MPDDQKAATGRAVAMTQDAIPVLDTARFEHMHRIATAIGHGTLVPKHLVVPQNPQATIANCFRVVNQAIRWGFDPFAIIDETYAVGQKLGYSGKLIAGVINAKAGLKERLKYTYNNKTGDDLTITVHGTFQGETEERVVEVRVGDVKTNNGMWTKDPHQKLIYTGATKWGRAHAPEILLGIITDDDIERMKDMGDLVVTGDGTYVPREDVPARPTRTEVAKPEPYRVVDVDGVVTEYDRHDAACAEFERILTRTAESLGEDKLDGVWEANAELLGMLREREKRDLAEALHAVYGNLLKALEVAAKKKADAAAQAAKEEAPAAKQTVVEAKPVEQKAVVQNKPLPEQKAVQQAPEQKAVAKVEKKPAAPWVASADDPPPKSPMRQNGPWIPFLRWLKEQLVGMPLEQVEDFLSERHYGQEWQYLGEKRAEVRQEFDIILDQRRVPNG